MYSYLYSSYIATPCGLRIPLLNYTSRMESSQLFQARMSGDGWCGGDMCTVGSKRQYLQADFGAEVVIEAIAIDNAGDRYNNYVTRYNVEYGSDTSQFHYAISKESNGNVRIDIK